MRVAYVTGMHPARLRNGTEIATTMVVQGLAELGHDVVVAGYARPDDTPVFPANSIVIDRRPIEFSEARRIHKLAWVAEAVLRNEPLSVAKYRRPGRVGDLRVEIAKGVDAILVDKPQIAALLEHEFGAAPLSVVWHAIEHQTYAAVAKELSGLGRLVYRREARLSLKIERDMLARVSHVFCLTAADARSLGSLGYPGPLDVLPMTFPTDGRAASSRCDEFRFDIGLLGNWTWSANASGLAWFLRHIVPKLPNATVAIGGAAATSIAPEVTSVTRISDVAEARAFLGQCRAVAIPVNAGTGVSMKVLEAASTGWPTVTTPIGARGIDDLPDNVEVASSATEFAEALRHALQIGRAQRTEWGAAGRRWMEARRASFRAALASGLNHLALQAEPRPHRADPTGRVPSGTAPDRGPDQLHHRPAWPDAAGA